MVPPPSAPGALESGPELLIQWVWGVQGLAWLASSGTTPEDAGMDRPHRSMALVTPSPGDAQPPSVAAGRKWRAALGLELPQGPGGFPHPSPRSR